ncbi:MAG TPA: sugar phosphate isomerase/epimerase family protein [Euzebyales bacterium]|nr:sugar phosphate isomerase/epimerase family protein [Euzebyales bacterium]
MTSAPQVLGATGPFMFSPLGWTMDLFSEAGFTGVEVLFSHSAETRDSDKICNFAREAGLSVPVVHGPYMLFLRNVLSGNYVDKSRRSLELADEVGASILVAHAPMRWERAHTDWARTDAADEAADRHLHFGMENLYPLWGLPFSSVVRPDELTAFRHVVFDTSHFAVTGVDLFQAWHALRDRVVHLHVSNNLGNGKDSHAPLDTGMLPIDRFLAHVGRSGYSGTVTLELDIRPYADDRDDLVRFLSGQRERAERWLRGELPAPDEPGAPGAQRLADELALDETGVGVPIVDRTPASSGHARPGRF